MKPHRWILSLVLCVAMAASFPRPSLAERPILDSVPAVTPPPEMRRPVVETELPPRSVAPTRRNLDDPRDGTNPLGDLQELSPEKQRYVNSALKAAIQGGGDDVLVVSPPVSLTYGRRDVAIANNGDIYVGISYYTSNPVYEEYLAVYRSQDGGTTFSLWGTIGSLGTPSVDQRLVSMSLAEGSTNRLYVQYMELPSGSSSFNQYVAYSDPSLSAAAWTTRSLFVGGYSALNGEIINDSESYSAYYLYAVCSGIDGDGDDIWYTRSTDLGNTWSAPYRIAELTSSGNLMYSDPQIAYEFGGNIHVVWTYTERLQSTIDDGVRTRRATNYGGSISDWDPSLSALRFVTDGIDQHALDISAATDGNAVVVLSGEQGYGGYLDPHLLTNTSAGGSNWSGYGFYDLPWDDRGELVYRSSDDHFVGAGREDTGAGTETAISSAPLTDLSNWSATVRMNDPAFADPGWPRLALDPSHGDRVGLIFPPDFTLTSTTYFDGEWRSDPGYPNYESGFPMDLPAGPSSPPAIVDVDGDSYGDIVYGDLANQVWVISHLGAALSGWPQTVPNLTYKAPIAAGPVDGSDESYVVAGTQDGKVYAFAPDGSMRDGFPVDLGTGAATYVAIGDLGAPYPHWIVAASGQHVYWINYRGISQTTGWYFSDTIDEPIAIGDVDGDNTAEIVTLRNNAAGTLCALHVFKKDSSGAELSKIFSGLQASGAPTLFDLDFDGKLEIAVPTSTGQLHVIHADGTEVTGFPYDDGSGQPLTEAAAAQVLSTSEPDLAFCSLASAVHLVLYDGVEQSSYPQNTGSGWWLYGAPILNQVNRSSGNVLVGSRDKAGWSFQNTGGTPGGWPKFLDDQVEFSPASGDIDNDGHNEIVFLGNTKLHMVDVNYPDEPLPSNKWPMYGYDSQRTNCLNCGTNLDMTAAPEVAGTRVSFAAPSPNPSSGSLVFQYRLPSSSNVSLEVFDVRGRRIRTVVKEMEPAGPHVLSFDGRDRRGAALASGQYFARLRVKGPGLNEVVTRKFSLLR